MNNDYQNFVYLDVDNLNVLMVGLGIGGAGLLAGLGLWARSAWAAYKPVRALIARLERLAHELERGPGAVAPSGDSRAALADRLLLLDASGKGDSPRAQALRQRLGMTARRDDAAIQAATAAEGR